MSQRPHIKYTYRPHAEKYPQNIDSLCELVHFKMIQAEIIQTPLRVKHVCGRASSHWIIPFHFSY